MNGFPIRTPDPETDAIFDTSPLALATRFGLRAHQLIRERRDPYVAARLAASYAFMAMPEWRKEPQARDLSGLLWDFVTETNRDLADRLRVH